jgi:hypothetical protein
MTLALCLLLIAGSWLLCGVVTCAAAVYQRRRRREREKPPAITGTVDEHLEAVAAWREPVRLRVLRGGRR